MYFEHCSTNIELSKTICATRHNRGGLYFEVDDLERPDRPSGNTLGRLVVKRIYPPLSFWIFLGIYKIMNPSHRELIE